MNPFSQGWSNTPQQRSYVHHNTAGSPSLYGALPFSAPPNSSPNVIKFTFLASNGTILNSPISGPQAQIYFRVTTDSTTSGFSVVQNARLESIAVIEWRRHPVVEIYGIVSKRDSSQLLSLSPDRTHRIMNVRGRNFRWMPHEHYVGLYSTSPVNPQFFGRILQTADGTAFEVTAEALQIGLLEIFVVSSLLLMCGRSID
ncbi:hypothetical protein B0H15DRAFT_469278 [Mycena belliarum]|uniref:DUF6593 domain-containing protein n=1 Tax=Mycena belliarum TaxID=1033014 RepID=A0AAD6U192_9AGAR|nr:hypothetical protein B0H15DRAFT_469278 [Mycena belliae]